MPLKCPIIRSATLNSIRKHIKLPVPVTALFFFIIFAASASIVLGISLVVYYPESLKGYVETNCVVVTKNLQNQTKANNDDDFFYRPVFTANVTKVESNDTFIGEATYKRRRDGWEKKLEVAQEIFETFEVGVTYVCCYDPEDLTSVIIGADLNSVQERFDLLLILSVLLYGVSLVFLGNSIAFWLFKRETECCSWSSCSDSNYEGLL